MPRGCGTRRAVNESAAGVHDACSSAMLDRGRCAGVRWASRQSTASAGLGAAAGRVRRPRSARRSAENPFANRRHELQTAPGWPGMEVDDAISGDCSGSGVRGGQHGIGASVPQYDEDRLVAGRVDRRPARTSEHQGTHSGAARGLKYLGAQIKAVADRRRPLHLKRRRQRLASVLTADRGIERVKSTGRRTRSTDERKLRRWVPLTHAAAW